MIAPADPASSDTTQEMGRGTTDPESPYARAREGVTRKQQESEPEPSVTEPLLLTVATDCGDESRGVRVDCAAHAVAKLNPRSRLVGGRFCGEPFVGLARLLLLLAVMHSRCAAR